MRSPACIRLWVGLAIVSSLARMHPAAMAEQLFPLRNGLTLRGTYIELPSLNQNAFAAAAEDGIAMRPIWMIDDGLSRTYVHRRGMVSAEPVEVPDIGQRIEFFHPVNESGNDVSAIGSVLDVSPFDDYGRRQLWMRGVDGRPIVLHQGMTEINARYVKLDALAADTSVQLDMRLATSSIDSGTFQRIFRRRLPQTDVDRRLDAVRFFIESQRFGDAHAELERVILDFPDEKAQAAQLPALLEQRAIQLFDEATLRRDSGQTKLAATILRRFPVDRVGRVTRQRVVDAIEKIDAVDAQIRGVTQRLDALVAKLDPADAAAIESIITEIRVQLSPATLPRLSDFSRLGGNEAMSPPNRVALAIAGWLLGSGSGEQNLKIAAALVEVRSVVREYLRQPDPVTRTGLMDQLRSLEASRAEYIARMLPLMRPPLDVTPGTLPIPEQPLAPEDAVADEIVEGMFRIGDDYLVQLPPEYDPNRTYPCIVALHAAGADPATQLNWWSGVPTDRYLQAGDDAIGADAKTDADPGDGADSGDAVPPIRASRLGQSMRHGFIVLAPLWTRPGQRDYEYTPREHDAVMRSLRSAMRRFSIDSDRVFIGGHGPGGTAAWDIAVSHPDIWAGMIPINADPGKTLLHYIDNSIYVPLMLIGGEKDGAPLKRYGAVYDDYMTYKHDAMVILMRGRGREFFSEKVPQIFDWMKSPSHRRAAVPSSIEAVSMRAGDQFFWWLEWAETLPDVAIDPILWDQAPRIKAAPVETAINANNEIRIGQAPSDAFTVWLAPTMPLKFDQPITVRYRSRRATFQFDGTLDVLLEDVRTRADRNRPFWGRVSIP